MAVRPVTTRPSESTNTKSPAISNADGWNVVFLDGGDECLHHSRQGIHPENVKGKQNFAGTFISIAADSSGSSPGTKNAEAPPRR
jgi:hypothetical protein